MRFKADASDLQHWAEYFDGVPFTTKQATVNAINRFGHIVVHNMVTLVAEQNGWDPEAVRQRLVVKEADAHNMEWLLDASLVVPRRDFNRPWATRGDDAFDQDTLINVITQDDGFDCQLCRDYAADNPHPMQDVLDHQAQWADYVPPTPNIHPGVITNLMHPRCRCVAQPWTRSSRLPPTSIAPPGGGGNVGSSPSQLVPMRDLQRMIKEEIQQDLNRRARMFRRR